MVLCFFFFILCQGHELVQHVLYHLYSLMILGSSESSSNAAVVYEKFLLAVVGTDSANSSLFIYFFAWELELLTNSMY